MQATPENNLAPKADLMKELDGSFQYEGRLEGESYQNANYRCGFVSIIGAPNMGKSTLLNALIKEELCIATARPQTTRHAILGLLNTDQCQVCLVDTPGVIDQPAYKLQEGMMEAVIGALYDADVLLVVTDLFSTPIPDDELFQKVVNSKKPVLVCVNKVDLAAKVNKLAVENEDKTVTVEEAIARWRQLLPNALAILPLVASNGPDDLGVVALRTLLTGGPDLPAALRNLGRPVPGMFLPDVKSLTDEQAQAVLPLGPPLYDSEILTDRPSRFIASEMIRAALFESLHKELPYCCEVQIESFKDPEEEPKDQDDDGSTGNKKKKPVIRISASIFVERDGQKVIVIGKNGQQIKKVGIAARAKLEEFFQCQVRT
jgi:GTP-binding protein Era